MNPSPSRLEAGASLLGLELSPDAIDLFGRFLRELLAWGARLNLTGAHDAAQVEGLHFLDSLLPLAACPMPRGCRVVDVGSGAGLPGVPLKIARPDLHLTLVESSRRRVAFLEHLRLTLGLTDIAVRWARAEDLGHDPGFREVFDIALSRAAARLRAACELCLPLVCMGGAAVLLRGPRVSEEIRAAEPLVHDLGGSVEACALRDLPTTDRRRAALVIRKERPTPALYPRRGRRLGTAPARRRE